MMLVSEYLQPKSEILHLDFFRVAHVAVIKLHCSNVILFCVVAVADARFRLTLSRIIFYCRRRIRYKRKFYVVVVRLKVIYIFTMHKMLHTKNSKYYVMTRVTQQSLRLLYRDDVIYYTMLFLCLLDSEK